MTLTKNGVITEEAMLAYLNGILTPEDTAKFEQLIDEDPFAREALEGLQTSNVLHLKTTFKEQNQNIAEQSGTKQHVSTISFTAITRYAVAAALVGLLVGLGFLVTNYINNQPKQLAMETAQDKGDNMPEARPLMEAEETPESDAVTENDTAVLNQIEEVESPPVAQEFKAAEPESKPEIKAEPVVKKAEVIVADKKEEERKKAALQAKEQTQKVVANSSGSAGAATPNTTAPSATIARAQSDDDAAKSKSNAKDEIASDYNDNMDAAMQSFNNHDYKAASKQFGKILNKEPDNKDALYFQSVSEYINGNSKSALKGFEKLLEQNTKHIEGSKYYKSQILLKKGKKDEARALLEELSRSTGAFKQRAVEKLEEMK